MKKLRSFNQEPRPVWGIAGIDRCIMCGYRVDDPILVGEKKKPYHRACAEIEKHIFPNGAKRQ